MWTCACPCVNTQKPGLPMDTTKVATNGPASSLALYMSAPREAKKRSLESLGLPALVLSAPNYDVNSGSPTSSRSSPSSHSIDKTDNHDTFNLNPDGPDMRLEDERIKTFDKWPISFLTPKQLAQNGFYYLGRGDEVRCAFCKVEIMKWMEGDDPAKDHQRWAPQCPIVRKLGGGGRDECGARAPSVAPPRMPGPVHKQYASEAARLKSFKDWPRCMPQKPEELAEAGFFYTGQGDKTRCFYCDGGLKDWEADDVPWEQHARWFDRCAYVQLVKGQEYVQKVMTEACAISAPEAKKESTPSAPATSNLTSEPEDIPVADSKLCKICYAAEQNVCFVPCGHVVACAKCALSTDKCPMCRRTFQSAVRLYYS